jgi:hypothetical protein
VTMLDKDGDPMDQIAIADAIIDAAREMLWDCYPAEPRGSTDWWTRLGTLFEELDAMERERLS